MSNVVAMSMTRARRYWHELSLPGQFVLAGSVVMLVAMVLVGSWVAQRIEQAALQNSGINAANYVESFIVPITQDLADDDTLSSPAQQAMIEVFSNTSVNERIVSYKIWKEDGLIAHASDPSLIGQRFEPSEDLVKAWRGTVAASLEEFDGEEDAGEASLGIPLLEVYAPIHEIFSGRIIAVAEFYERADLLKQELSAARRTSWLLVGSAFLISGLLLAGIVKAGGRTIREQRFKLQEQLQASQRLAEQNNDLRKRAITANVRATAQLEQSMRRVGSDLHDGPAQHLSLAALRLDSALGDKPNPQARKEVRASIDRAMEEIRDISRGLALPELEDINLSDLLRRAVLERERQSKLTVETVFTGAEPDQLAYARKLCIYRFLQEGLSNAVRHGEVEMALVEVDVADSVIRICIRDSGKGFDINSDARGLTSTGGQGLGGLQDRAESIGGDVSIASAPGQGTQISLTLSTEDQT